MLAGAAIPGFLAATMVPSREAYDVLADHLAAIKAMSAVPPAECHDHGDPSLVFEDVLLGSGTASPRHPGLLSAAADRALRGPVALHMIELAVIRAGAVRPGQQQHRDPVELGGWSHLPPEPLLIFSKMAGKGNGNRRWSVMNTVTCPRGLRAHPGTTCLPQRLSGGSLSFTLCSSTP